MLIAIAAVVIVGTTFYGGSMLICKSSLRSCSYGGACAQGSVCVDYGGGIQKCSVQFCATVKQTARPIERMVGKIWNEIAFFFQQLGARIK
jgi:hypothetical protein